VAGVGRVQARTAMRGGSRTCTRPGRSRGHPATSVGANRLWSGLRLMVPFRLRSGRPHAAMVAPMQAPSDSRWPDLADVRMRYRVGFAYVDGFIVDGPGMPLCLLR
jgi:hypothetical protein